MPNLLVWGCWINPQRQRSFIGRLLSVCSQCNSWVICGPVLLTQLMVWILQFRVYPPKYVYSLLQWNWLSDVTMVHVTQVHRVTTKKQFHCTSCIITVWHSRHTQLFRCTICRPEAKMAFWTFSQRMSKWNGIWADAFVRLFSAGHKWKNFIANKINTLDYSLLLWPTCTERGRFASKNARRIRRIRDELHAATYALPTNDLRETRSHAVKQMSLVRV